MNLKGGISDFWKPMLIFKITKTNTPLPQKGLAPILIAPPHTYVCNLGNREETKQPRRPIAGFPAPWALSSAGKLIRYLHESYFLPYHNTMSTPDVSGETKYYRSHNQWCCLHWMGHDKSPTGNCCRFLFMMYRHKFQMIFSGRFVAVRCRQAFFCSADVFLLFFLSSISIILSSLGSANFLHVY